MNGPIRKVSIFVAILMAALLVNLTYTATVRQEPLLENPLNRRVRDAEFARDRGAILAANDPIALSEPSGSQAVPFARSYPRRPHFRARHRPGRAHRRPHHRWQDGHGAVVA